MKQFPKRQWRSSRELTTPRNTLGRNLNRLMVLDYVWGKLVGNKARFWTLKAVQKNTIFVQVNISVARNELTGKRRWLVSELNKHFETPWIKHIEII